MKITLMDIMESLNSDNEADAQAALHEWFVAQSKQVHGNLTAEPVAESEESEEDETEEKVEEAHDWGMMEAQPEDMAAPAVEETQAPYIDPDTMEEVESEVGSSAGMTDAPSGRFVYDIHPNNEAVIGWIKLPAGVQQADIDDMEPELLQAAGIHYMSQLVGGGTTVAEADDEIWVAYGIFEREDEEDQEEGEEYHESALPTMESLIAELSESFQGLETVSDKLQNVEGAQVGEEGKVPVNTKATLPSHKGDKRVGGSAVEIKGKGHTGHALEKAPKVADVKVKGNVQNSKDDPKKVTAEKSALLNKMDGSVNTQSPISGKGAKGLKK